MKRTLAATFVLLCAMLVVLRWRQPGPDSNPAYQSVRQGSQTPSIENQERSFPTPRAIRSPFTDLARQPVLVSTKTPPQNILVEWHGRWHPAEIVQSDRDRHLIRYAGYGDERNEWVGPDRIRNAADAPYTADAAPTNDAERLQPQPGDFVVKWGNRWWRAQPLEQNGQQTLIRYVGYGAQWDEWVTPERSKVFTDADAASNALTEITPALPADLDGIGVAALPPSAKFLVEWNGSWYPADVLAEQDGKYFIHYEGYGNNWDEWIRPDRLRAPEQQRK